MFHLKINFESIMALIENVDCFWIVSHQRAILITIDSVSEMGVSFRINHTKRKYVSLDTFFKGYWKARVTPQLVQILLEAVGTPQQKPKPTRNLDFFDTEGVTIPRTPPFEQIF